MSDFVCPLCQQANQCLAGTSRVQHCWCMQQQFPPQLLAKTPDQTSCICQPCLQQAQQQTKAAVTTPEQTVQLLIPGQIDELAKAESKTNL